jgi:hypothetical protein
MVFSATFNNISVISWRLVLLVDETGENNRHVTSYWQILSYNVVSLQFWYTRWLEETRVLGENHLPVAGNWQTVSHNDVSSIYMFIYPYSSDLHYIMIIA